MALYVLQYYSTLPLHVCLCPLCASLCVLHLIIHVCIYIDGILYELGSMHDNSTKAISTIVLSKHDTHVSSRTGKLIVDINYDAETKTYPGTESTYESTKKLHILFLNGSDCANFLRNVSEFTSKPNQTLERGYKAPATAPKKQDNSNNQPQQPVKKADVLSSTYGL